MVNPLLKYSSLLLLVFFASCKQVPYGDNKETGKYYNIRGFKMYCETYGSGKPLLMIHGDNGSISTFAGLIPVFAKKYKVIVADSRSQGRSRDDKDSLSFEMMADDYATLLDSLHVDSAYVIGWSDGGINALLMAIRHPEKVKKIASSGANLWPDSTAIRPKEWLAEMKEYDQFKNKDKKTYKEKNDWKLMQLEVEQPHISLTDLHKIKCPTMIICGDHDFVRMSHSLLIYENIPQANFWIVPNSGHGTLFEHKRRFIYNVNEFFDDSYTPYTRDY